MLFGYNPSRKTGRKSRMFSRPEPGTQASIQPIGNPVPVNDSNLINARRDFEKQAELERIRFLTELDTARANDRAKRESIKKDGEITRFQALLNDNNINPEAFAGFRKQSQANKMRKAYSSFLSGLD